MLDRWNRIIPPILCVGFAALSVWSFTSGDYGEGALLLAFSVFWLAMTLWGGRRVSLGRRRSEG